MALPSPARTRPPLAVVLVNWNGADDSIECLESLLRSEQPLHAIVVDNGSDDGSLDRLAAWAEGREPPPEPAEAMRRLSRPALDKPIKVARLDAAAARSRPPAGARLTLIDAGANLGFAGGNNLGLAHALLDPATSIVWLLNNDTVVEPTAAGALVRQFATDPRLGMVGSVVRYYHRPDRVQALNGYRFRLLTGQGRPIHHGGPADRPLDPKHVADVTDFVLGASIAVSRAFVETVGPMDESYFLYFEEIDWAVRNDRRFRIGYARGATVYHKEGGSIGSSGKAGQRSAMSDYYLLRSRLRFYRRHYPLLAPLQYLQGAGQVGRRLIRRQPAKAAALARALLGMGWRQG